MSTSSTFGGRRGVLAAAFTVVLLVLGGGLAVRALTAAGPPPQPDISQAQVAAPSAPGSTTPSPTTAPTATPRAPASDFGPIMVPSAPVALRIPSIKVATKGLVDLALDDKGELEAPKDFRRAGWYAAGPTPGEFGPSVIAAHVDSHLGPAVFYRLGALGKGAEVMVERRDGSTATFRRRPRRALSQGSVPHLGGLRRHRRTRRAAPHHLWGRHRPAERPLRRQRRGLRTPRDVSLDVATRWQWCRSPAGWPPPSHAAWTTCSTR